MKNQVVKMFHTYRNYPTRKIALGPARFYLRGSVQVIDRKEFRDGARLAAV